MHPTTLLPLLFAFLPTTILALPTAHPAPAPSFPLLHRDNTTTTTSSSSPGASVARAGGTLNAKAAAAANQRDETATRAFSGAAIKTSDGSCLTVDPLAGDFRQNLIPVELAACDGGEGQKWDVVTKGKHVEGEGAMLVVSAATQGCLNFDPRRAAGDQVLLFSCGGRADGEGKVTDSQEFAFDGAATTLPLSPLSNADTCLVADGGKLGSAGCSGGEGQAFTIG